MKLRGISFSPVFQASGVTNLDCGGYWHHWWLHYLGLNFEGTTKVTKTTPLLRRIGNMPLKSDGVTPKERLPRCVIVNFKHKAVLNAVSLSSPGLEFCINAGWWQQFEEPFFISIMSVADTREGRLAECEGIMRRLAAAKKFECWRADWGIQWNWSCPNLSHDPREFLEEMLPALEMADEALPEAIPIMLKLGPETPPEAAIALSKHKRCDALTFSNTLKFGSHPAWSKKSPPIDWKGIFGTDNPLESPMAKRFPGFPGGYSGAGLKPFVLEWVTRVRELGVRIPIIAGGGIVAPNDPGFYIDAGADGIALGTIATLNPLKVRETIRQALFYLDLKARPSRVTGKTLEYNV
jgi:dihydroorotate dehydrogenase